MKEVDSTLTYYLDKINSLSDTASQFLRDALVPVNKEFVNYLTATCIKNSNLIADFSKKISTGLSVEKSPDNNIIIYTWNFRINDTMRFPFSVVQYRSNGKWHTTAFYDTIKTHWDVPMVSFVNENVQIQKTADKKTVYIIFTRIILDNTTIYETVRAFTVSKNTLTQYHFFQTLKESTTKLSVQTDWSKPNKCRIKTMRPLINVNKGNILIPVVNDMIPTDKFLIYKFNGYRFVYDKTAKG